MKPRIDITAQNSFAIWESGFWRPKENIGRSTLVCGPDGEKLDVIFDNNPQAANFHYLFFAQIGQVVATAFIRQRGANEFHYDLSLKRIQSISVQPVQGQPVARAKMDTLLLTKQVHTRDVNSLIASVYPEDRIGYNKEFRSLLEQAIEKAFTEASAQRLFWGNPRRPRD